MAKNLYSLFFSQAFGNDFLEEKLKPFLKSDPVPESVSYFVVHPCSVGQIFRVWHLLTWWQNDGDVKIVVGNNFDEIVLDESKDVLLEVQFKSVSFQVIYFHVQLACVNLIDGCCNIRFMHPGAVTAKPWNQHTTSLLNIFAALSLLL